MTAEEFLERNHYQILVDISAPLYITDITHAMKQYARMHVEAALKAAAGATLLYDFEEEILNSYPLTNIK